MATPDLSFAHTVFIFLQSFRVSADLVYGLTKGILVDGDNGWVIEDCECSWS
jgi:hypothetical protein